MLAARTTAAQAPEQRPLLPEHLRHAPAADAGPPLRTRTILLVTTTESVAQEDSAVAALAADGITVRHLLGSGVLLGEVPDGADISELQRRARRQNPGRLHGLYRAEEASQARALANGRNRRALDAAIGAIDMIQDHRQRPTELDLLEVEGRRTRQETMLAPEHGADPDDGLAFVQSFRRASGPSALEAPLWFGRHSSNLRMRDIERSATSTRASNMIS